MDETVDGVVGGCKIPGQCSAGDAGLAPADVGALLGSVSPSLPQK